MIIAMYDSMRRLRRKMPKLRFRRILDIALIVQTTLRNRATEHKARLWPQFAPSYVQFSRQQFRFVRNCIDVTRLWPTLGVTEQS